MYFDIHTHLDKYSELSAVVKQINEYRIFTVTASVDIESYQKNKKIASSSDLILPTFGIHPSQAFMFADRLTELDRYITESPVIGEIGLDYLWVEPVNIDAQKTVFRYIVNKVVEQDKFMVIHTKDAETDILDILTDLNARKVVVHWYSGTEDIFNEYLNRDWYFTYGVELESSKKIQSFAAKTPLSRILAETDNPVGVEWLSGKTGMPNDIISVYNLLAKIKKISSSKLTGIIESNAKHILNA